MHARRVVNTKFLDIHDCPRLKELNGLCCPALAVARITSCRELCSLALNAPMASRLDLSGCVRLGPWELGKNGDGGVGGVGGSLCNLQVGNDVQNLAGLAFAISAMCAKNEVIFEERTSCPYGLQVYVYLFQHAA